MAIANIPKDAKPIIYGMVKVFKKDSLISERELEDLERLKEKRIKLSGDMEQIEEAYHLHNINKLTYT